MKIIHICDLDGTLLKNNGQLDPSTVQALRSMIGHGLLFSIATARSPLTVNKLFQDIPLQFPMILLKGALLLHPDGQTILANTPITPEEKKRLLEMEKAYGLTGFKCLSVNGRLRYSLPLASPAWKRFADWNGLSLDDALLLNDRQVEEETTEILYVYYADDHASSLWELNQHIQGSHGLATDFYQDRYIPDTWFLELFSRHTTKGQFVSQLKEISHSDHTVVYGDGINDLPLFAAADFCCAVANAAEPVRRMARRIIGSNEEDGVIGFMEELLRGDVHALR